MFADPKEIKKRREREHYTLHRGEILKNDMKSVIRKGLQMQH
jgi:hypothetical protein